MRGHKLIFCAVGAFVAVFAAVAAIVIFKNEIVDFLVDVKEKIDEKLLLRRGEYADYADM